MTDRMDTCASCRFYHTTNGECRRRAAVVMDRSYTHLHHGLVTMTKAEWPQVLPTDWCGEYEVKRG